jgi:hypothetical protein
VRAVSDAEKIASSGNLFLLFNVSHHCICFSICSLLILFFGCVTFNQSNFYVSANIIIVLLRYRQF